MPKSPLLPVNPFLRVERKTAVEPFLSVVEVVEIDEPLDESVISVPALPAQITIEEVFVRMTETDRIIDPHGGYREFRSCQMAEIVYAYKLYIENSLAEVATNTMICVIHQTNYLLDRQLRHLEARFLDQGGFTERLNQARRRRRENPVAIFKEEATRPTHPVNPLDISGNVIAYDPIMLPPHMLFRAVEISEDWFVFSGRHRVHVPGRVMERGT